jgi:cation transport ATPase
MIHIPFFLPLFISGLASAVWRECRQPPPFLRRISLPEPTMSQIKPRLSAMRTKKVFDDMGELQHYQRVSWYALAFSASGWWIYPPAVLLSIPLLSYNSYNFAKTLAYTDGASRTSPLTVFEVIAVAGAIATGRPIMASLMFLFVFGSRNLFLKTRNLANVDFQKVMDANFVKVWTLHDGVEIEATLSELRSGDIVVIHGGDLALVEGRVLSGEGLIRQYSLQKTMKAVPKQVGDMIFPFTQLESGCLHVEIV